MIIYKITNKVNGKVYIGLTTCTLKYRWSRHLVEARNKNNGHILYRAIRKYGEENFDIEQIDEANDKKELSLLERKYIKMYDSTNKDKGYNLSKGGENQYDGNPMSKVSEDDVIRIRMYYKECVLSVKECWSMYYKDVLSYSGFQKIWDGTSWQGIMQDVYTKENIAFHSKQRTLYGEKQGGALYSNIEVLEIRKFYVNHTLKETYAKYGERSKSILSFRNLIDSSYLFIPIYSKIKKVWLLNGKEIDINDYKPVSTIPGSGK